MTFPKLSSITAAQWMKLAAGALALADMILAYGDKVQALPLPGWLVAAWPFVLVFAVVIHSAASFFGVTPDLAIESRIQAAIKEAIDLAKLVEAVKNPESLKSTTPDLLVQSFVTGSSKN